MTPKRITAFAPGPAPAWFALGVSLLLALVLGQAPAQDDPYQRWSMGRPQDAIPGLLKRAQAANRWDAWLDVGLAAAAAGDRGRAAAWLTQAHLLAPERDEPGVALRALGSEFPATMHDRLGPMAWPGSGWAGVLLIGLGGLALGYALVAPRGQGAGFALASACLLLIAPAALARVMDGHLNLVAIVHATRLLDSAGTPEDMVAPGTVAVRDQQAPWANRWLVSLPDGRRGYIPIADTRADESYTAMPK